MSQEDEAYAMAHFGVKGMHWGVRQQRASDAKVHSEQIMKGRRSAAASAASTAGGKSAKPLRPRDAPKNASVSDQILARALQQGYDRATSPAVVRYFDNAPKYNRSADPKVNEVLNRVMSQGANRVETAAGQSFIRGLPPGVKLQ